VPWRPAYPGEVPSLGFEVLEWMSWALAAPDRAEYEPFVPTREQAQFVVNLYALDPRTGRRRFRRAVMSRPKGWGKSPFLAAIALAEALAPVVPDGWDAAGRPVAGRGAICGRRGFSSWPSGGSDPERLGAAAGDAPQRPRVRPVPGPRAAGHVREPAGGPHRGGDGVGGVPRGQPAGLRDPRPDGVVDADERRGPAGGDDATEPRQDGGVSIEAPNAYRPGMDSVAQASAEYAALIRAGKAKDEGLLYDHREAPAGTNLADRDSLLEGLRYVYGDSHWVDLERIVAEVWDPATEPQDARQYYGNMITHASDSWLSQPEWAGCADATKHLADRELVTLGFDGSVRDDTTALVACRVSTGTSSCWGVGSRAGRRMTRRWTVRLWMLPWRRRSGGSTWRACTATRRCGRTTWTVDAAVRREGASEGVCEPAVGVVDESADGDGGGAGAVPHGGPGRPVVP
jgi:hypothetical protein